MNGKLRLTRVIWDPLTKRDAEPNVSVLHTEYEQPQSALNIDTQLRRRILSVKITDSPCPPDECISLTPAADKDSPSSPFANFSTSSDHTIKSSTWHTGTSSFFCTAYGYQTIVMWFRTWHLARSKDSTEDLTCSEESTVLLPQDNDTVPHRQFVRNAMSEVPAALDPAQLSLIEMVDINLESGQASTHHGEYMSFSDSASVRTWNSGTSDGDGGQGHVQGEEGPAEGSVHEREPLLRTLRRYLCL